MKLTLDNSFAERILSVEYLFAIIFCFYKKRNYLGFFVFWIIFLRGLNPRCYPLDIHFFMFVSVYNTFLRFCKEWSCFGFFVFLFMTASLLHCHFLCLFLCTIIFCVSVRNETASSSLFFVFWIILLWKNFMTALDPRYVITHWISIFYVSYVSDHFLCFYFRPS